MSHDIPDSPVPSRLLLGFGIAFSVTMWGAAFVGIRDALGSFSPSHLALFRYLVASLVLAIIASLRGIRRPALRDLPRLFVTGLFGIGLYNVILNYGEQVVSAGSASFLGSIMPIFTTLLSMLVLGERVNWVGWLGMLASFGGAVLISLGEGGSLNVEPRALVILIAAFCSSVYLVVQKPLLTRYSSLEAVCWAIWTGTAVLLPFAGGLPAEIAAAPARHSLTVVFLGVFPAALAYFCWTWVLSTMSASRASSFLYFTPIAALVIAWLWLGEVPHGLSIAGGGLALSGVVVVNRLARHTRAVRPLNGPQTEAE